MIPREEHKVRVGGDGESVRAIRPRAKTRPIDARDRGCDTHAEITERTERPHREDRNDAKCRDVCHEASHPRYTRGVAYS